MATVVKQTPDGWCIDDKASAQSWPGPEEWDGNGPLRLAGDAEPEEAYANAAAIAVDFPAFNDGRGLSLAVLLRTRYNFAGELRACGAVHEDIAHYMVRCGFDNLELSEGRNAATTLSALFPYSANYQASVTQPEPAFRRAARGV